MARKFLYLIAFLIVLTIAALVIYRLFPLQIMRTALIPSSNYAALPDVQADRYRDPAMWLARPDQPDNPGRWVPPGEAPTKQDKVAVFYIHPTSYINRAAWNAPLNDAAANELATVFLRGQATAFNGIGKIWAPRYRQATFGAFLTNRLDSEKALNLAYRDVSAAFDEFQHEIGPDMPIILVGHSQGSLHLARLLRERVAGKPIAKRIIAAYVVGWPISRRTDLPLMGLPECERQDQAGCILSWQSFADPADTTMITDVFDSTIGFNGQPRKGTPMICTNPITGTPGSTAPAAANRGTLVPSADLKTATNQPGLVSARCSGRGFLLIGPPPPGFTSYILPGNNFHVFDYSLFWSNIRADAARRAAAFGLK
ncbi:MAG: DUF3089 domain-containing protein [Sphingomonas sp.]|nr:DUF3089 domain-containing protein [Sphingomonas sp.]